MLMSMDNAHPSSPLASDAADTTLQRRDRRTIRLEPTRGFRRILSPAELWRFRDLAVQIAVRDVTVRYRQTALGAIWAVLQPVGTMVVFSIFFGKLAGLSSNGQSYALFSLAALVPWTFFANSLLLGSDSLVANAPLVSKTYFPRVFIPAGVIVAGLVDLGIALVILLVIALATGIVPTVATLMVPVLIVVAVAAALGMTCVLSAVNVKYRDVRYVVPFAVQIWLFATPVVYSSLLIQNPWRTVSAINPMVGVVEGFRWAVLGGEHAPWPLMIVSGASAAVMLLAGLAYFDHVERGFADIL
jgi:lipopolysaccharide transport system permease protein